MTKAISELQAATVFNLTDLLEIVQEGGSRSATGQLLADAVIESITQLHDRQHSISNSNDHTATAHRVFYSNDFGQIIELPFGTAGQVLTSNGVAAAPSFEDPAGGPGGEGPPFNDDTSLLQNAADPTKELRFEVGSILTGTQRVVTWPDQDLDMTPGGADFAAKVHTHVKADITDFGVLLADLPSMNQNEFMMRFTAGTGAPEHGTPAQARTALNVADGADATDATSVDAAGAVMHTDVSESDGYLLKTGAEAYVAIKTNRAATAAPGATNDSSEGYSVGSLWIDVTNDKAYVCVDASVGAAVWIDVAGAAGGAPTGAQYLTLALNATLTGERRFVAGSGLAATDGGANANYTLAADYASQAEAEAGTENTKLMTPLRTAEAITAQGGGGAGLLTTVDDAGDYSVTSFKVGSDGAAKAEQRRFTGNQDHNLEFIAANLSDGDYGWLIKGGTGTVTLVHNDIALNGDTVDIELTGWVRWVVHNGEVLITLGGTGSPVELEGTEVVGNLLRQGSRSDAGTALSVGDSGGDFTTAGPLTIPNTPGWHCDLEIGVDTHDLTFNNTSLDISVEGFAAGELYSVRVRPSNAIRVLGPAGLFTEANFV